MRLLDCCASASGQCVLGLREGLLFPRECVSCPSERFLGPCYRGAALRVGGKPRPHRVSGLGRCGEPERAGAAVFPVGLAEPLNDLVPSIHRLVF